MKFFTESNLPPQSRDWADAIERELKKLSAAVQGNLITSKAGKQIIEQQIVQINESAKISNANVSPFKSFDFNVDGGMVNSNYGGLDPLDGGKP